MSSTKRRRRRRSSPDYSTGGDLQKYNQTSSHTSESLFIEAHEATIIRNRLDLVQAVKGHGEEGKRGGLIRLNADIIEGNQVIWVDRYDARLLLSTETSSSSGPNTTVAPSSPTGWSDLPSDAEETFYLQPDEIEDMRRRKHRRLLDSALEERLRAMKEADPDPVREFEESKERWGDDDEEPEDTIRTLMERTANHLAASPRGAQLEMRILANHGANFRFAFLRGRWKNTWEKIRGNTQAAKDPIVIKEAKEAGMESNGLVSYGSDSD